MARASNLDACTRYALDVDAGRVDVCSYIKTVCRRHLDLLDDCKRGLWRKKYRYNPQALERFNLFSGEIRHFEGNEKLIGKAVEWLDWQQFFFGNVYAWEEWDEKLKIWTWKHKEIYLEVPKKNGKSFICAAIALYDCGYILPSGAKVFIIACDGGQVRNVFEPCTHFIDDSDEFSRDFSVVGTRIYSNYDRSSYIQALPKQKENADGKNALTVIADEIHAHDDDGAFYRRMRRGVSARSNYHVIGITTAGFDKFSFCKRHRDSFVSMLTGDAPQDPSKFAMIYTADKGEEENWRDEWLWRKTNPCYGAAKRPEHFAREIANIEAKPFERNEFLVKDLNIWADNVQAWLDSDKVESLFADVDLKSLEGKRCFLGVDLARKRDLSAVVAVFPKQDGVDVATVFSMFFIDEETAAKRAEASKVPYEQWRDEGYVRFTKGSEINFEEVQNFIETFSRSHDVEALYYDPAFAQMMMQELKNGGMNVVEFRQNGANYTDVIDAFEKAVTAGKILFAKNDCYKWNLYNVEIITFSDGRMMPFKGGDANKKIDGAVAGLMAYKGVITKTVEEKRNAAEAYLMMKGYRKDESGKWVKIVKNIS